MAMAGEDEFINPSSNPTMTTNSVHTQQSPQQNPSSSHNTNPMTMQAMIPAQYSNIHRLNIPDFNCSDPAFWFVQAEEQFSFCNIHDENARYSYLIAALPSQISSEVRDIIMNKPQLLPYTKLKQQLFKRLGQSQQERLKRLLHDEVLGDQKPTQFLIRLQSLTGNDNTITDQNLIKTIFLQQLPRTVQQILAPTSDVTSVDKLAEMADNIMLVNKDKPVVNQISNPQTTYTLPHSYSQLNPSISSLPQHDPSYSSFPNQTPSVQQTSHSRSNDTHFQPINNVTWQPSQRSSSPNTAALLSQISMQLSELTRAVQNLTIQNQGNNQQGYSSRSRSKTRQSYNNNRTQSRSPSPNSSTHNRNAIESTPELCWYHQTFGDKATRCSQGCPRFSEN